MGLQSRASPVLQLAQFTLLGVQLSGTVKIVRSAVRSAELMIHLLLGLFGKRSIHGDGIKSGVHALAEHVNHVVATVAAVTVVVIAGRLGTGIRRRRSRRVGPAGTTRALRRVQAGIRILRRGHCHAGSRVGRDRSLGWHDDGQCLTRGSGMAIAMTRVRRSSHGGVLWVLCGKW